MGSAPAPSIVNMPYVGAAVAAGLPALLAFIVTVCTAVLPGTKVMEETLSSSPDPINVSVIGAPACMCNCHGACRVNESLVEFDPFWAIAGTAGGDTRRSAGQFGLGSSTTLKPLLPTLTCCCGSGGGGGGGGGGDCSGTFNQAVVAFELTSSLSASLVLFAVSAATG